MKKPVNSQRTHSRFYFLLTLLLILMAARYALQIPIPRMVLVGVITLAALLGDMDEILAILMCCIPLHEAVDFFFALVFITAIYAVKCHRRIRIDLSMILVLALILWELLHCLGQPFSIVGFVSGILPLAVLAILLSSDVSELDYAFVCRVFAIATLGLCATLLIRVLSLSGFNIVLAVAGLQRLGLDSPDAAGNASLTGGAVNPNTLGIICVLASAGLLQLRTAGQGSRSDILIACGLMIFGALTASRTYLVCLALMLLLLLFSQKGRLSDKLRFLLLLILVLLLALAVLHLCFPDLMRYYIGRFRGADLTTGRADLMVAYHHYIVSDPEVMLFGIGLQDLGTKLTQLHRVAEIVPHNAIQELVIAWGLPGLIAFCLLILVLLVQSRRFCPEQGLLHGIPLIVILVKSQAGQLLTSPYTMLTLSFAYLSLCARLRPDRRFLASDRAARRGAGLKINQTRRKSIP